MKAESVSKDGVPIDWCERCECAVIHEATLCEDCVADIAISDEEFRGSEQVGVERYDAQMETQNSASVPAQSITSYDLAKALRRILDSGFAAVEVERAHDLLKRYDSQNGGSNG